MTYITARFGSRVLPVDTCDPTIINAFGNPRWAATREAMIGQAMLAQTRREQGWTVGPRSKYAAHPHPEQRDAARREAILAAVRAGAGRSADIADAVGLSVETIRRYMAPMHSAGLLRFERRGNGGVIWAVGQEAAE